MLIAVETSIGQDTVLKNKNGAIVSHVISFDTVTKEAELFAYLYFRETDHGPSEKMCATRWIDSNKKHSFLENGKELVTFKCHLDGVRAFSKSTGEEII